jgi:hypothetical protein
MLPIALSEVLGISLLEVMARYFDGVNSSDEMAIRVAKDVDRMVTENEGKVWLASEQHKIQERLDLEHQGAGVDDTF